jgi:hypothetical protein
MKFKSVPTKVIQMLYVLVTWTPIAGWDSNSYLNIIIIKNHVRSSF